jgi:hypothetical protein
MTRARHITHGKTTERLEKTRQLITALMEGQLRHDQIGPMLELGPSAVRKYLADLCGKVQLTVDRGERVLRLTMTIEAAQAYLDSLIPQVPTSGRKGRVTELTIAASDPRRHLHIMRDDEYYHVRVSRAIPQHEPVHAAFWRMGGGESRA